MIITCEKSILLDALSMALKAVSNRTTMAILECVLIKTESDSISLSSSDKEISIDTFGVPAEIEKPGQLALNAKLLTDIVRKMPGEFVTIQSEAKDNAIVTSGRSKLKISGLPADEFPVMSEEELMTETETYEIKSNTLREMIRQTSFSISSDPSKLILTGELFDIKDSVLRVVAVDMYRISYRQEPLPSATHNAMAVIPGRALNELSRILPGGENDVVDFYFTKSRAIFKTTNFVFVTRLLEGDFIRYDQIFNDDFMTQAVVDREELLSVFERSILIATENRSLPIKLDITSDDITITAHTERGQIDDGIPCAMDGNEISVYFNPRYFIEALRAIDDKMVTLRFNTAMTPSMIRGVASNEDPDSYKYLIVPLRSPA